jgi:hypothetical protein
MYVKVAKDHPQVRADGVRRDAQRARQRSIGAHIMLHQMDNLTLAFGEQRFDGLHLRTARSLTQSVVPA